MWHELWILIFVVLVIIGVAAGEGLLIGFSVMGLLIVGTAKLWNRASLEEVTYERSFSLQRVFIGEKATLTITLTNRKPLPLGRVRIEDDVPTCMTLDGADVVASPNPEAQTLRHSTSMSWYERVRWTYEYQCDRRGFFRVGPSSLRSGDLFGFFNSERIANDRDYVLVYPRVVSLPEIGIPSARPLGETRGGIRIFEDFSRPMGLRDYQMGDALKMVDWKATAKMSELQVRTYESSSSITAVLAVAVDTMRHTWEGYSAVHLERIITAAASLAVYASERQYTLGLFSNGTPVLADRPMKIAPSQSPDQLTIILEALASIRPLPIGSIASQLSQEWRRFPLGATVVIVLSLVTEQLAPVLETMQTHGYKVVVVYVGDDPCPAMPPGVILHEIGSTFEGLDFAENRNARQFSAMDVKERVH